MMQVVGAIVWAIESEEGDEEMLQDVEERGRLKHHMSSLMT